MNNELWEFLTSFSTLLSIIAGLITIIGLLLGCIYRTEKTYKSDISSLHEQIKKIEPKNNISIDVFHNVEDAKRKISELISSISNTQREISIDNFGLDLSTMVSFLEYGLRKKKIVYRGLIINSKSEMIKKTCSPNYGINYHHAEENLKKIIKFANNKTENSKISIKITRYNHPPVIHGFLLDKCHLFISLTHFVDGSLHGGDIPYLYFKKNSTHDHHKTVFDAYNTWFDFHWQHGNKVDFREKAEVDYSDINPTNKYTLFKILKK